MRTPLLAAAAALALGLPLAAQDPSRSSSEAVGPTKTPAPAPSEIVAAAPKADWMAIPAKDLLVMTLAPDAKGKPRQVVIQLMPAPFSQGWVHNIRLFARSGWYDGISVNRVQDNYVTQWGDPNYDNPEATGKTKPLPDGLKVMTEAEYTTKFVGDDLLARSRWSDAYAGWAAFVGGWPVGTEMNSVHSTEYLAWPTHCYGMVGVGRNYSPDTGSGAELYTVIGHAPRHLDRNIALVGRVIEGMQHLSSLPRGSGALGFYTAEEADKRTPILTVRVASDLPADEQPQFEYLSTESDTFATYAEAIANRRDPFFIVPAGGADICNIRVPVRRAESGE
ncbi:peptidylprolyl isomerase [Erythrobacter sp. sf7]|uniref:Peptidylprolyl isomerase n=1 Tax=Erythrobacter fulvus TaxID=2987523 RepID=A0ABT5JS19_9SPHN|nr:peptidylprolyl isomerase [Erythrobacter fulvus]MDC8755205.1 peptidylprolyl isomerase [Erythrobacter fulvus]